MCGLFGTRLWWRCHISTSLTTAALQCPTGHKGDYAFAGRLSERTNERQDTYTSLPASEGEAQRAAAEEQLKQLPSLTRLSDKEHRKLYVNRQNDALRTKALNMGYLECLTLV